MRLNGTGDLIDEFEYPTTSEDFVAAHGDHVIELQRGSETLGDVVSRVGPEEYDCAADLKDAVRSGVSHKAIGRRFYSDRDPTALGESGPTQLSF
ncbi:DUF2795 domain-containing protein [Haloplanus sp. GCM10025708]|uniref:DUF5789 family protein n=1 Tax=Haloferacaceae TaxID=1644056 RepID=UPI0036234768